MTAFIQPDEWLRVVEDEYLSSYICNGGSTAKFAIAFDQHVARCIREGLAEIGDRLGYAVVRISASDTKIHMMDEIFFRTAEQLPWQDLSRRVIRDLATRAGYAWPDGSAHDTDAPLSERIASQNKVDSQMLLLDLKKQIANRVFKERKLAKDFRVAMTHLCLAELAGGSDGALTVRVLTDWLTGRNRTVGVVKPFQIFRKINRGTARYFFESMVHWVRLAGHPGVLLLMDTARLMLPRDPQDRGLYYTKAAVLDAYEVLREFIDGADRVSGYFLVVLPSAAFLEDHSRGLSAYEALKFRVFDEVRDKRLVNPMGSLVRIATGQGGERAN
ncbi:MAG: BREX system ATP-binding domain-containing protein [Bryobacteraceae bacterium]|jgi:hypothetical protein